MQERAIGYIRTSTDDQALSVEVQKDTIKNYCQKNNLRLVAVQIDEGVSGGAPIEQRVGLMEAVTSVGKHRASQLVIAKRDRLARDTMVSAMVERAVESKGARIASCDGVTSSNSPEGRMLRQMLDVFSEYERQLIKSRTKAALHQKRLRGEKLGGVTPFGWDKPGKVLVKNEEEQKIIKTIKTAKKTMTYDKVVEYLRREGYTMRNKPFSRTTVARICKEERSND